MNLKAKDMTLIGQILAALQVIGWSAYFFIKNIATITMKDIIVSACGVIVCFCPVFINMVLDKVFNIVHGVNDNVPEEEK